MTDREKLARQWAERVYTRVALQTKLTVAAAEHIMATTTPPTMADVEWDDEKHHLAGAVFQNPGTATTADVVMFHKDGSGAIIAVDVEDGHPFIADASKYTPNGKRYELREVTDVPDHLSELLTETDYLDAPIGTIIVVPGEGTTAVQKLDDNEWGIAGIRTRIDAEDCARASADHGPGTVLRWGGEE